MRAELLKGCNLVIRHAKLAYPQWNVVSQHILGALTRPKVVTCQGILIPTGWAIIMAAVDEIVRKRLVSSLKRME